VTESNSLASVWTDATNAFCDAIGNERVLLTAWAGDLSE
jgi:hypothetical protein